MRHRALPPTMPITQAPYSPKQRFCCQCVQPDTLVMTISVYDDDDAADRANGLREQDISQWQLRDVTLLRGTLDLMHIKT